MNTEIAKRRSCFLFYICTVPIYTFNIYANLHSHLYCYHRSVVVEILKRFGKTVEKVFMGIGLKLVIWLCKARNLGSKKKETP